MASRVRRPPALSDYNFRVKNLVDTVSAPAKTPKYCILKIETRLRSRQSRWAANPHWSWMRHWYWYLARAHASLIIYRRSLIEDRTLNRAMEHQSLVDQNPAAGVGLPGANRTLPATLSVSAGIAAVTAHPPRSSEIRSSEIRQRFPGEDGGQSLAEMACNDLDAALQLLAERAQYITGASGAAIALRRGEHNDMLCRATAGSNAPELAASLTPEDGTFRKSVRRRQAMRCDDAENDPRVNREGCRRLGISSSSSCPLSSAPTRRLVGSNSSLGMQRPSDERWSLRVGTLQPNDRDCRQASCGSANHHFLRSCSHQAQRTSTMASAVAPVSASEPTVNYCAFQNAINNRKEGSLDETAVLVGRHGQEGNSAGPLQSPIEHGAADIEKTTVARGWRLPRFAGTHPCVECEEQWCCEILRLLPSPMCGSRLARKLKNTEESNLYINISYIYYSISILIYFIIFA